VEMGKGDPLTELGIVPAEPAAFFGWGSIPDQYGRRQFEDEGEDFDITASDEGPGGAS
jgi:hypothetical protein